CPADNAVGRRDVIVAWPSPTTSSGHRSVPGNSVGWCQPYADLQGIRHQDGGGGDSGDGLEAAAGDGLAELGHGAVVAVARALAGELLDHILAEDVGGLLDERARLTPGPEAGREDDDHVLELLRERRHPALAVGEA